jgi:hypothetical protein
MKEVFEQFNITLEEGVEITPEKVAEITSQLKSNIRESILNDPKFYDELDLEKAPTLKSKFFNDARAQVNSTLNKEIEKTYGLTTDELSQISDEEKRDSYKMLKKAHQIASKRDNSPSEISALQLKLTALSDELELSKTEKQSLVEKLESEYKEKLTKAEARLLLSSINGNFANKIIPKDIAKAFELIEPLLEKKYSFVVENGNVEVRQKSNPNLKVEKEGQVGKYMTVNDILEMEYRDLNLLKDVVDTTDKNNSTRVTVDVVPDRIKSFSDVIKRQAEIEKKLFGDK